MKEKEKIYHLSKKVDLTEEILQKINDLMEILSPGIKKVDSKRFAELIDNPLFELYLLELEGQIAGMASLHFFDSLAKKSVWVEDVVIHPKHQGKGLGKKIMKHVMDKAKKRGARHIDLSSSPHRKAANKLYQKLNFEPRNTNWYRLHTKRKKK
jgi:GNAT superfamily N-acetyltransferase